MTKQIIGRGHEFRSLYILDSRISRPIVYSGVTTPFETHCRLGHPSLSLLKKLCPQFSSFPSLDCDSCQFAKHRLSSHPRVNKRVGAPFELVHSNVWDPCLVVSPTWFWCSELFSHFRAFCAEIHTQFHVSIQNLRSDNAKEYMSK